MSEEPKTLKFPEFDDFHSTRDYVLAIKKFRKALVTELQKRIDQAKEDLNSANFNWDEKSELKGKIKVYSELLVLLGEKEKRKCPRCEAHKQQHSTILTDLGHCQRVTCNYCGYYYDIGKEKKNP